MESRRRYARDFTRIMGAVEIPYWKAWRKKNPEKYRAQCSVYYQKMKADKVRFDRFKQQVKDSKKRTQPSRKNRLEVISVMGGKCARCFFSDWRALQIDHVHGDGALERRTMAFSFGANKRYILEGFAAGRYQLLCANCQWIKRHEKNEHGTKERKLNELNIAHI